MILPTKHLPMSSTLLGMGAEILPLLEDAPHTMTTLWEKHRAQKVTVKQPAIYASFVLALDFLFLIGLIHLDPENRLVRQHAN